MFVLTRSRELDDDNLKYSIHCFFLQNQFEALFVQLLHSISNSQLCINIVFLLLLYANKVVCHMKSNVRPDDLR